MRTSANQPHLLAAHDADALLPAYLRAVVRFARATGDIHALSAADVRLIALAHGLEVAAHGSGHLRDLPEVPVVQKKKVHDHKEVRQVLSHVAGVGAVHAVL